MESINTSDDIRNAIHLLEDEQTIKLDLLKAQAYITFESLKPVNIIKSTIKEISTSPYLVENLIGTATSLATGFISRKIVVGGSGNLLRKLFGAVLQFGVTNLVANHPEKIRSMGHSLIHHFFHKKDVNPEKP